MYWRQLKGESWASLKGSPNKRRFKKLVLEKKAHGAIAYCDGLPVGWVSFERRVDLYKLDRAPSFKCDGGEDTHEVWSVACFYIKPDFRSKGVASQLLEYAVSYLKKRGAKIIEGYPVKNSSKKIPAAFAWTGTVALFERAGFCAVGSRTGGKQRMRIAI
jgi:GNAT superfamily N-acetyltransferase